ncbi:hypothetical protein HDU83_009079, partial [Entophlyctis luteolus]
MDELSRAQRQHVESVPNVPTAFSASADDIDARILNVVKKLLKGSSVHEPRDIYVGNLPAGINEYNLKTAFNRFGNVRQVKIMKHPDGTPKGYAFVVFHDSFAAKEAVKSGQSISILGQIVK